MVGVEIFWFNLTLTSKEKSYKKSRIHILNYKEYNKLYPVSQRLTKITQLVIVNIECLSLLVS